MPPPAPDCEQALQDAYRLLWLREARLRQLQFGRAARLATRLADVYFRFVRPHLLRWWPQSGPTAPSQVTVPPAGRLPDVVVFPVIGWGFLEQRPQHFVRRMAAVGHRCFYLDTQFGPGRVVQLPGKVPVWGTQLPGPGRFDIYRQPFKPAHQELAWQGLQKLRDEHQIGEAVALVQHPFWAPLVLRAARSWGWKLLYDCMDDHHAFPGVRCRLAEEQELARSCQVITVTHPRLASRFAGSRLIPNGSDFDHFSRSGAFRPLQHLPRPIIGYHGMIGDWLDVPLLVEAARARPQWTFVLVGPRQGTRWLALTRLANVYLLDQVPYELLPNLVTDFDAGCIPFSPTALTASTDPVKLYELLSAGRPVVVSGLEGSWPTVRQLGPGSSLVEELQAAMAEPKPIEAQEFARQQSWDQRFRDFYLAALGTLPPD